MAYGQNEPSYEPLISSLAISFLYESEAIVTNYLGEIWTIVAWSTMVNHDQTMVNHGQIMVNQS